MLGSLRNSPTAFIERKHTALLQRIRPDDDVVIPDFYSLAVVCGRAELDCNLATVNKKLLRHRKRSSTPEIDVDIVMELTRVKILLVRR